jgi:hypothetical protein
MASPDPESAVVPEPSPDAPKGYVRRVFTGSRALLRIVYRDPEHVAERLTLYAVDRIADEETESANSMRPLATGPTHRAPRSLRSYGCA